MSKKKRNEADKGGLFYQNLAFSWWQVEKNRVLFAQNTKQAHIKLAVPLPMLLASSKILFDLTFYLTYVLYQW